MTLLELLIFVANNESMGAQTGDTDAMKATPVHLNRIKSQLTCKVCLADIVGIISLPCSHLGEKILCIMKVSGIVSHASFG